tara:strand:- start:2081 stop:2605 length:525 start_codon:yes stop_codon:yes gene_type:complete
MLAEPSVAADYVSNFERVPAVQNRPPQVGTWHAAPTVIVCEAAPISETQITSAVQFWKRLDYEFNRTQYKQTHSAVKDACQDKSPAGYIVIHLVTQGIKMEDTALAQTHFYVDNDTTEIEWAIIYIRNDIRATILEHELGHALGFLHFNQINHLMNEKWTMGGWDKEGLENKQR